MHVLALALRELIALGVEGEALVSAIDRLASGHKDEQAERRRERDRAYQAERRRNRQKSAESADAPTPSPKDNSVPSETPNPDQNPNPPPYKPPALARLNVEFETVFWPAWPDKRNRGAAEKAFAAARRIASLEAIMAGVPNVTETHAWRDGHRVHASTWLNGKRWLDEPEGYARGPPITGGMVAAASDEAGYRMALEHVRRKNGNAGGDHQRDQGVVVALPPPATRLG